MKHRLVCLILGILMILTCTGCGSSKKPEATLRKYVAAYNRYDREGMIECYEPDVQKLYHTTVAAGNAVMSSGFWGAVIGSIAENAQKDAEANKPKLKIKIKGRERLSEDRVVLTVEYTYTAHIQEGKKRKTEKTVETLDVEMVRIDDVWYIAAPVDLSKLSDSLGTISSELAPIVSDAAGMVTGAISAIGSALESALSTQPTTASAALNKEKEYDFSHTALSGTPANEIAAQLVKGVYNVRLKGSYDPETVDAAVEEIRGSYPELFWVNGYQMQYNSTETTIDFRQFQDVSAAQLSGLLAEEQDAASEVLSQLPKGLSDYDKALWVHDYLVDNCTYDQDGREGSEHDFCHTVYGCLVKGEAVCEGYARTYQYLMQALGLPCGTVSGTANGPHAWNYLSVDDTYYWVDVTWDDPVSTDGSTADAGSKKHTYFLLDDEHILRDHAVGENNLFVPECTSMKDNYFVRNGIYFEQYDRAKALLSIAAQHVSKGRAEMMFATEEAYSAAVEDLIDNNRLRDIPVFHSAAFSYFTDDSMYVLSMAVK